MKRRSTSRRGRGEDGTEGGNKHESNHSSSSSSSSNRNINNNSTTTAQPLTGALLRPLLVECLSYLDEESIRRVCLVSKHYHNLIHTHPKLKQKFIAIIEIRAVYNDNSARSNLKLSNNLYRHRDKLQHYQKIKIIGLIGQLHGDNMLSHVTSYEIAKKFKLQGIVALDMSLPVGSSRPYNSGPSYIFSSILPNLRELDLSNTQYYGYGYGSTPLWSFFKNCSCLEKLTWNNSNLLSWVNMTGVNWMHYASNLKELYIDDSAFIDNGRELEDGRMSDLEDEEHAGIFLFYECTSKVLERISMKNAKYRCHRNAHSPEDLFTIPQTVLIKYIRNAPTSLRWFRSDLSDENITMLQNERLGIEFTN